MSKVEISSSTINGTGTKTILTTDPTMQVEKVVMFILEGSNLGAAGFGDQTINFTSEAAYASANDTKSLTYFKNISGVKTKVLEATVPSNSFVNVGEFKISVTTLTASTKVWFALYGS